MTPKVKFWTKLVQLPPFHVGHSGQLGKCFLGLGQKKQYSKGNCNATISHNMHSNKKTFRFLRYKILFWGHVSFISIPCCSAARRKLPAMKIPAALQIRKNLFEHSAKYLAIMYIGSSLATIQSPKT